MSEVGFEYGVVYARDCTVLAILQAYDPEDDGYLDPERFVGRTPDEIVADEQLAENSKRSTGLQSLLADIASHATSASDYRVADDYEFRTFEVDPSADVIGIIRRVDDL